MMKDWIWSVEAGNFLEAMEQAGRRLIYAGRQWYGYDGTKYVEMDDEMVTDAVRLFYNAGASPGTANGVMQQARAMARKNVDQLPAWLGADPYAPADDLLATKGGVLDTRSRNLYPHTPDWLSTVCLPYPYDPGATCPTWEAFLYRSLVDADQIEAAQEWAGYCLTHTNPLEKLLWCYGPTRAGKGVFAGTISAMVGEGNAVGTDMGFLSSGFGLCNLLNKQVATIGECQVKDKATLNAVCDTLKRITGRDGTAVNVKYRQPVQTTLGVKLIVQSNELPRIPDESGAMVGRILMLKFPNSNLGKEDTGLKDKLKTELPGILNWALVGLARLRERGNFLQPAAGMEALEVMAALADPFKDFVADYITAGADRAVPCEIAYTVYQQWCGRNGYAATNANGFGGKLHQHIPGYKRRQRRVNGKQVWHYFGLSFNEDAEQEVKAAARIIRMHG